jgi:CubicO group peptidase (beta-lactamase class C family)
MLRILLTLVTLFGRDGLPLKTPAAVGMSSERLEAIDRVMRRAVEAGGFAGAAVVVGRRGAVVWQRGYGRLDWSARSEPVDATRTMYDLASLTKVVATTSAIMVLHDRGELRIDDPVSKYLPAFSDGAKSRVTIRQLLEHRSGLPAGRDVWRTARSSSQARRQLIATPLVYTPGERELYSDIGADILGFIVESVSGEPLDVYVRRQLLQPLGMTSTTYRPSASLRRRIAPTDSATRDSQGRHCGSTRTTPCSSSCSRIGRTRNPTDAPRRSPSFRTCAPTLRTSPSSRYWTTRSARRICPPLFVPTAPSAGTTEPGQPARLLSERPLVRTPTVHGGDQRPRLSQIHGQLPPMVIPVVQHHRPEKRSARNRPDLLTPPHHPPRRR